LKLLPLDGNNKLTLMEVIDSGGGDGQPPEMAAIWARL